MELVQEVEPVDPVAKVEIVEEKRAIGEVITSGSLWKAIWDISWPLLVNMFTIAIVCFNEMWIAGRLGYEAQAALGFQFQIWNLTMLLATAMSSAATALVSRFWGARDYKQAAEAARYSLICAALFGTCTTVIGLLTARSMLRALGATPAVEELGMQLMTVSLLGQIGWNIIWIGNSIFRAKGDTRIPMITWIFLTLTMIAADWGLCMGPLHLGVVGLGLSSASASVVGALINIYWLSHSDIAECVSIKAGITLEKFQSWMVRLLRIGLPACLQDLTWLAGNFFFLYMFSQTKFVAACQASYAIGFRVEEIFAAMPIYALHMAAATLVGQNLGAQQPERAEEAGWQVARIGLFWDLAIGIGLFVFAKPLATIMSPGNDVVIDFTAQFFQILGVSEPLFAIWLVLFGAMQGAGYTRWTMIATCTAMVVFRLPLGWFLLVKQHMVPSGAWIAMASTIVLLGVLAIYEFKRGRWKLQKV